MVRFRCADCGKPAPASVPESPDQDGIRDGWQETIVQAGPNEYYYQPVMSCDGCTGALVDATGAVVQRGLTEDEQHWILDMAWGHI